MSTIVTRAGKGSALTWTEGDANVTNLNNDKLELTTLSVTQSSASGAGALSYNNTSGVFTYVPPVLPSAGIASVVVDTTPQLGGTLDCQGEIISNPILQDYAETIDTLGSTDAPTLTVSSGNVKTVTITSGLTLSAFSDAAAGQSVTLIVSGGGTVTGTGAYKFANGTKTLTSESVISIFYDGTTYWTSVATNYTA